MTPSRYVWHQSTKECARRLRPFRRYPPSARLQAARDRQAKVGR